MFVVVDVEDADGAVRGSGSETATVVVELGVMLCSSEGEMREGNEGAT